MKTLKLNLEETKELKEYGHVEIVRKGFDIVVEIDDDDDYQITIINPYKKITFEKEI
jgi:hypothetical protein